MSPLLAALALLAAPPGPHDASLSFSHLTVRGDRVRLDLTVQTLSLLEVLPALDLDGDGLLGAGEVSAGAGPIGRYCAAHYRLSGPGGPLPLGVEAVTASEESPPGGWVSLSLAAPHPAGPRGALGLEADPFAETSPGHVDRATFDWNGARLPMAILGPGPGTWSFEPPSPGAVLRRGLDQAGARLLERSEPLALLVLLGCAAAGARPFLAAGGAFLLGSLGGLALAGPLGPPLGLLELAAPLSVAYLATDLLLQRRSRGLRPLTGAVFGILQGLALGASLAGELSASTAPALARAGHLLTLGMALVLALPVAGLPALAPDRLGHGDGRGGGVAGPTRLGLTIALGLVGLGVFARRAFLA